jgi:glycosyltransferase involved in cell wall biosynthesis
MSSYNIFGGTPKKTLDQVKFFNDKSVLYVYNRSHLDHKPKFVATNAKIYEGFYGRNIFLHLKKLLNIIDTEQIDLIQTQFSMGEILGSLLKIFRPKVKLIIAFVGPFKPSLLKKILANLYYHKTDAFVYITNYVKNEKTNQFPILLRKKGVIIYNGTERRTINKIHQLKKFSLFDTAGLVVWKNIQVLIKALDIIVNKNKINNIHLYIAGEGPYRNELEVLIKQYKLHDFVYLLGYQDDIGGYLDECDVFVHPAYAEGFGIAVAEAMHSAKPIIVSNAGALPELITNNETGLIVDAHNPNDWAKAIIELSLNSNLANKIAINAQLKAQSDFSILKFNENYKNLYKSLINQK